MLGYVHFDRSGMKNERTEILVPRDKVSQLARNKYVKITDSGTGAYPFLGRIVEGPFFSPEEVARDSALAQTSILKGDSFPAVPEYYAVGGIEILGQLVDGNVVGANIRPAPQSKVEELPAEELQGLLNLSGDLLVGDLDGYPNLRVCLSSRDKKVIPRNIGIFGTVGSGKTNTAQVIIEDASRAGYAVVVLDVEGEYVEMDQASTELGAALRRFGRSPEGLAHFTVYYPVAGESEKADATPFTLRCADLDPLLLSELIEAEEAQERRLLGIIDELVRERPKQAKEPATLKGLVAGEGVDDVPYTLNSVIGKTAAKAAEAKGADQYSYYALLGKLGRLNRTGAFDAKDCKPISAKSIIRDGHVSIIDVSYSSDVLKNLVIADVLRKVFEWKRAQADNAPKTLIVIEEAHSFISRETIKRMHETVEMLREIARRGRKRWLGLCFISQQPAHLPTEIFELCNTRIVHSVKSQANLGSLKLTAGDVAEEIWNMVPSLGIGQAVISSPQFRDPLVVNVRPAQTKRKFVE